jgi:hypothetical protein
METQTITAIRPIYAIARDVRKNWKNIFFGAKPYLDAMDCLDTINDKYGCDDAKGIILYFLCNASAFRGEKARELKAELKKLANLK